MSELNQKLDTEQMARMTKAHKLHGQILLEIHDLAVLNLSMAFGLLDLSEIMLKKMVLNSYQHSEEEEKKAKEK